MGVVRSAEGAQECQVLLKLGQGRTVSKGLLDLACISILGSHGHHLRDIEHARDAARLARERAAEPPVATSCTPRRRIARDGRPQIQTRRSSLPQYRGLGPDRAPHRRAPWPPRPGTSPRWSVRCRGHGRCIRSEYGRGTTWPRQPAAELDLTPGRAQRVDEKLLRIQVMRCAAQRRVIETCCLPARPNSHPRWSCPAQASRGQAMALKQPGGPLPDQPRRARPRTASSARRFEFNTVHVGPDQNVGREQPRRPRLHNAHIALDWRTRIRHGDRCHPHARTPCSYHEPGWTATQGPDLPAAEVGDPALAAGAAHRGVNAAVGLTRRQAAARRSGARWQGIHAGWTVRCWPVPTAIPSIPCWSRCRSGRSSRRWSSTSSAGPGPVACHIWSTARSGSSASAWPARWRPRCPECWTSGRSREGHSPSPPRARTSRSTPPRPCYSRPVTHGGPAITWHWTRPDGASSRWAQSPWRSSSPRRGWAASWPTATACASPGKPIAMRGPPGTGDATAPPKAGRGPRTEYLPTVSGPSSRRWSAQRWPSPSRRVRSCPRVSHLGGANSEPY